MERTYENRFADRIDLDENLALTFEERASGSVLIRLYGKAEERTLTLDAKAYSYVKIFVKNETDHASRLVVKSTVKNDAKIQMGLLDLEDAPLEIKLDGNLIEQGATMEFSTAMLCLTSQNKKLDLELSSRTDHTYGNMHNFAVVFDRGQYEAVAAGRIVKGAWGSESHQETRVLTMGKDHKCLALPILYIDENDVKASHALTVGQPDADQLYYLQSRGLSTPQAVGLLSIGYFKPVLSLVDDEDLRRQLEEEMESRVGMYEH